MNGCEYQDGKWSWEKDEAKIDIFYRVPINSFINLLIG
jgi:hypothetical protein